MNNTRIKLSPFLSHMVWLIAILTITIALSFVDVNRSGKQDVQFYLIMTRFLPWFILFIWSINFTQDLRNVFAFNYVMIEDGKFINVRYMTFFWIFPFGAIYFTKYLSYETQNIFGARGSTTFTVNESFYSEEDAMAAINKHSSEIREKRMIFFKNERVNRKQIVKVK